MFVNKNKFLSILIALLISTPFFINIKTNKSIDFHRYVGGNESYIISFPISIFIFILIFVYFLKFIINLNFKINFSKISVINIIVALSVISWIFTVIIYGGLSKAVIYSATWFFVFAAFNIFKKINLYFYIKTVFYSLQIQLAFGIFAVISKLIDNNIYPGVIFPGYLSIYNFEQYYILGSVLCYGLLFPYFNNLYKMLLYFIIIYFLCIFSENLTAQGVLLIFFAIGFIRAYIIVSPWRLNFINFSIFAIAIVLIFLFIPIISWIYVKYFSIFTGNPALSGAWARIFTHYNIIDTLTPFDFIRPISFSNKYKILFGEPHHQFFSYWFYGGFLQMILTTLGIIIIIYKANKPNIMYFLLFFFLSGAVLEPMSHPYILIQFIVFLSFSLAVRHNNDGLIFLSGSSEIKNDKK